MDQITVDRFYEKTHCDRCGKKLFSRIMSWFTEDCICHECSRAERVIRRKLPDDLALEGCGYIPAFEASSLKTLDK